jgi:serine phosphatase RsbU (regulator of sigma subunit)/PAS domain-containing protein
MDVERLARVSSTLLHARTPWAVIETLTRDGIGHLGGDGGLVCLVDSENKLLRPISFSGFQPSAIAAFYPMSTEDEYPLCLAARTRESVWVEDASQRERQIPELARLLPPVATASLPVMFPDGQLLVFGLRFGIGHRFLEQQRRYLVALVNEGAQAMMRMLEPKPDPRTREQRAAAYAGEELRERLLEELQQAQRLVKVGTWQWNAASDTMTWSPEMYTISGVDPGTNPLSFEQTVHTLHPDDAAAIMRARDQALRDGQPFSATQRVLTPEGGYRHAVTRAEVLLDGAGRVIGMRGTTQDVTEEVEKTERLAEARETLLRQTYELEREQRIREALQTVLLPTSLPARAGVVLGARYLSAEAPSAVGGDWYDAFWVTPHELVLVIGDVSGHDMRSAAIMGQLRNSLRAYALECHTSAGVMRRLNALLLALDTNHLATAICASFDIRTGILSWVNAGHVPPLVIQDGRATLMPSPSGITLGVMEQPHFDTGRCCLSHGDLLLLYTDGLVERRGEGLDDGLDRLLDLAAETACDEDLDAFCQLLTQRLLGGRTLGDDACLLAVRTLHPSNASGPC